MEMIMESSNANKWLLDSSRMQIYQQTQSDSQQLAASTVLVDKEFLGNVSSILQ